jgi:hypothetical protein
MAHKPDQVFSSLEDLLASSLLLCVPPPCLPAQTLGISGAQGIDVIIDPGFLDIESAL